MCLTVVLVQKFDELLITMSKEIMSAVVNVGLCSLVLDQGLSIVLMFTVWAVDLGRRIWVAYFSK